jgi:hypothetical protein
VEEVVGHWEDECLGPLAHQITDGYKLPKLYISNWGNIGRTYKEDQLLLVANVFGTPEHK